MKLFIISLITRRDLQAPLRHFKKIKIIHAYNKAPYNDMDKADMQDCINQQYHGFWDLLMLIKKTKPDIIQGIEPLTFPAGFREYLAILCANIFFKIPYFFPMLENRPVNEKFGKFIGFFLKWYLKIYAHLALFVIPLNKGAVWNLQSINVSEAKMHKILWGCWGLDVDEFKPDEKVQKENSFLFVGRLDESKGIFYLLDAFKEFCKKERSYKLIFVGDGPLSGYIKKYAANHGLENFLELKGIIKNKELPYYFQKSILTISPSITVRRWVEQVGMVNIQSMACGTPVLSTISGAIPEYVPKQAGILVKERDSVALKEAMDVLVNDKEKLKNMSQFGRQYVLENYDEKESIRKAEEFLLVKH